MAVMLVDCDNFFASCERAMDPALANKPVAVLSSNDGCIIARTQEVKDAGVTMGQPLHECRQILNSIGAVVLSSNFLLYRSFAKRLQGVLRTLPVESVEVYSIDESFISFDETKIDDVIAWTVDLQQLILRWTGIPVSVGIAPSKALAKIAVRFAKKQQNHVYSLLDDDGEILRKIPVQDVWGIGRRMAPKLRASGILTAYDLSQLTKGSKAIGLLDLPGRELVAELCGWQGVSKQTSSRKSITHTRSFGTPITDIYELRSALSVFMYDVASKLRRLGLVTGHVSVFMRSREQGGEARGKTVYAQRVVAPTQDTFALETVIFELIQEIFEQGSRYVQAGVLTDQLSESDRFQLSLEQTDMSVERSTALMRAIDDIYEKRDITIMPATALLGDGLWRGKSQHRSPYNNSDWASLPIVFA